MIYDTLEQLTSYRGLSPHLDAAIRYLSTTDLSGLPADGERRPIAGEAVSIAVLRYPSWLPEHYIWENHRRHHDIQIVIAGRERIGVTGAGLPVLRAYDEQKDATFYHPPDRCSELDMRPGVFAVFAPRDLHSPNRAVDGVAEPVVKAVMKVRVVDEGGW